MKRTLKSLAALLLALVMLLPLAACGKTKTTAGKEQTATPSTVAPSTEDPTVNPTTGTPGSETPSSETPVEPTTDTPVPSTETPDETETPEEKGEIVTEIIGNIRVQIYSKNLVRIEEKGANGFSDANTLCVQNRTDWNGVNATRTEEDGKVIYTASTFILSVPTDATSISQVTLSDHEGKSLWKYSSALSSNAFLPAPADTPASWAFNDSPRITPTEDPFGVPASADEGDNFNHWGYEKNTKDCYVFLTEKNPFRLREDFVNLTGRADIVPLKTLGLWFSRYHAYREKEFLKLIDDFREHGYPMDMLVVDTDWRQSGDGTGYRVNKTCFRDIGAFYTKAHDKNIGIVMNDHVRSYSGSMLSYDQLSWFTEGLQEKIRLGLDAWWYDRNWTNVLNSPFSEISGDLLGEYMYYEMSRAAAPVSNRTYLLSNIYYIRNGGYGSSAHVSLHRYGIEWTGDIGSTVQSLRNEIENMVKSGYQTSLAYYSSDIGGHTGNPYDELFVRWTQYGCLSPIMRYHSTSSVPARIPWEIGEKVNDVCVEFVNLRYRLMPLFYTLAYENYAKGLPMIRRLDFYYPETPQSKTNDQYLLGEDLLVAPFCDSDADEVPNSWLTTPDGQPGISVKFFNNVDCSGDPVVTRTEKGLNLNWGNGSPAAGIGSDKFSAIFEGKITIGKNDVSLGTVSDDGVQLFIDGELTIDNWKASDSATYYSPMILKAGSTHDITVRYYEDGGGALIRLISKPMAGDGYTDTRKVFIPEGSWIDLFSGEEIFGPTTVEVTMGVDKMPLYIKKGSLTVLTTPGDHAEASDWQRLTLDVYAGKSLSDKTIHYEDDATSNAYKDGAFRLTTYKTKFDENGKLTLKATVEAPETDPIGFEKRTVTLRLHGEGYTKATLDGKALTIEKIAKDPTAYPFEVEGGSPDGDVCVVTFEVDPNANYTLTVE